MHMEIIKQTHEIITPIDRDYVYRLLEIAGRTAYKSEDRITAGSAEKFLKGIVRRGHESVIEHFHITVRFITDRGVTHELVRHRLSSYTQESTRYVNYSGGIQYIEPVDFTLTDEDRQLLEEIEKHYTAAIERGLTPQQARFFLPNGIKTEIVHTANVREWRHILNLRTDKASHPQIRALMQPLLEELAEKLPVLFEDLLPEND